jgi:hypothetical protein
MDETNFEQTQVPPQVTEKPISVVVFGVLNIIIGCSPFIRTYPRLYKIIVPVLMSKTATPGILLFSLSCLIGIVLSIWLIVMGIGLLRMTKWARRGSIIYSWIQIGLFIFSLSYTIVMIRLGLMKLPLDTWSFWLAYMHVVLFSVIYPVLLLVFMKTGKVKRAFCPP